MGIGKIGKTTTKLIEIQLDLNFFKNKHTNSYSLDPGLAGYGGTLKYFALRASVAVNRSLGQIWSKSSNRLKVSFRKL